MQTFMESAPTDEPAVLAQRLAYCNVYLARSGEMLAQAKKLLNEATAAVYDAKGERILKAGAQLAGKIIAGYCSEEQFLCDWLERVNRGLVHSSDNLRSLLSFAKEGLRIGAYADNVQNGGGYVDTETGEWNNEDR